MLCIYRPTDRPIVYAYKMKLQASLGLGVLYFILALPLFVLITNAIFDSRQKNVYQVTFLAESLDLKTSQSSLPVMQFDDSVDALNAKGLCSSGGSTTNGLSSNDGGSNPTSVAENTNNEAAKDASTLNTGSSANAGSGATSSASNGGSMLQYRDNRTCEELEKMTTTSIEFCGKNAVVSAAKKGRGSYYYPNKPVWDSVEEKWDFQGSQRFFLSGPLIPHTLNKATYRIAFSGYPNLCETCTFYKLPCDEPIDEALLGIAIVSCILGLFYIVKALDQAADVKFVSESDQHPHLSTAKIDAREKFGRVISLGELSLLSMVIFLSATIFQSKTCEDSVPELYYGAVIYLVVVYVVLLLMCLFRIKRILEDDADPGQCNKFCDARFSNTVMFLPCQCIPGHDEPSQISKNESNRMCYACSHSFDECPQCKRAIEKRVRVYRGNLPPLCLSIVSFLQMTLPAVCAKWNFMHSACLQRDIEPVTTTVGCNFLLAMCITMIFVGLLGIRVADKPLEMEKYIHIYIFMTIFGVFYCGLLFSAYAYGLLRVFVSVSSEFEISMVRNMGFPDHCISEIMSPHAFKNIPPNTCAVENQNSIFYNFFSCRPCDKTTPGSCFGSLKYQSQQVYTNWATTAYGVLCIIDLFALIIALSVKQSIQRRGRESENRLKPVVKDAKNAFRQLLAEQQESLATKLCTGRHNYFEHIQEVSIGGIEEFLAS